jgi:ComF family protein
MRSGLALATLDLIFPALCPICRAPLGAGRRDPMCGRCWEAITRLGPPWCDVCGAAAPAGGSERATHRPNGPPCATCSIAPPAYDYARSAAVYEGALREALHALKFSGKRALARPLAELAVEQCVAAMPADIDAAVPVPLDRARERERGFNQAALLARRIARRLAIPTRPRWLTRVRATLPQSDLPATARRANVRGAFRASRDVAGRHVLLVDDILTTGATLGECTRALREGGARRVGVLTVARVLHAAV